jgi:hypothetical protein
MWTHTHAFLARNCGVNKLDLSVSFYKNFLFKDCENHAVLLCSLLLGFGLDAYVCMYLFIIFQSIIEKLRYWNEK